MSPFREIRECAYGLLHSHSVHFGLGTHLFDALSCFSVVFSIFRLSSIVRSFSIVRKGRRHSIPTPRGSLGSLGPYHFGLLTRRHSRTFHQLGYNGNPLHVFYARRANARGPLPCPLPRVLRCAPSLSHQIKSKSATLFVRVPKQKNPYVHLQVKLSDGSRPWIKIKVSDVCGEMHELRQQVFHMTRIDMVVLQFVHEGRLVHSLDMFKGRSCVRVPPVVGVPLRLLGGMEEHQDVGRCLRSQGSNMALMVLPEGNDDNSDSDDSRESQDGELLGGSSRVRTHDERATNQSDESPSVEEDPKRPCVENSGPDVNIQTLLFFFAPC